MFGLNGKERLTDVLDKLQFKTLYLMGGNHHAGYKSILEDAEIIEVKQGPYCGEQDKVRFDAIADDQIKLII